MGEQIHGGMSAWMDGRMSEHMVWMRLWYSGGVVGVVIINVYFLSQLWFGWGYGMERVRGSARAGGVAGCRLDRGIAWTSALATSWRG